YAVAVVEQDGPAGQVEVASEGHDTRCWRFHRRPRCRSDVHARVGRAGGAVVDALVAEATADAPLDRPDEAFGEAGARVVAFARGGDEGLFTRDALGDCRGRFDGLARHAVDPFDREVPWLHRDGDL